jgi:hypothetical protein
LPFRVNDGLVFRNLLNPHFGVVLFALEFQFHVQADNLGVLKRLGLLLESGVGECLLESNASDEQGIL